MSKVTEESDAMNIAQILETRRTVEQWQEHWSAYVFEHLSEELPALEEQIFAEIDALKWTKLAAGGRDFRNRLNERYKAWCEQEAAAILNAAGDDLAHRLPGDQLQQSAATETDELDTAMDGSSLAQLAGTTLAGVGGIAAVPAVVAASTATVVVPGTGILGLIGIGATTATAIAWGPLLVGAAAAAALAAGGGVGATKVIERARQKLKASVARRMKEGVIYSKKSESLAMRLERKINETAQLLLQRLDDDR